MAITAKRLIDGTLLTGALATLYTAPANTRTVIKRLVLNNSQAAGTAPVACVVNLIPSGGSASDANEVAQRTLAPGESQTIPEAEGQVLEAGGFLQASGLNVTIVASGVEITV